MTEVANKRPEDPIAYLATYLYNFAHNRSNLQSRAKTQEGHHSGPSETDADKSVPPASIDVVTVEPEDGEDEEISAFNITSRVPIDLSKLYSIVYDFS